MFILGHQFIKLGGGVANSPTNAWLKAEIRLKSMLGNK